MLSIHSYIDRIRNVFCQCQVYNGFTDNYLGIQPSWASVAYQALSAYRIIRSADSQHILPEIDTTCFLEALQTMSARWKFAGA